MTPVERLAEARGMAVLAAELQSRGILTAAGEMLWGRSITSSRPSLTTLGL